MLDADQLRAQAKRLQEQLAEAEAKEAAERERLAGLTYEQRIAEILHDHFAYIYGGDDEWYYEKGWGPAHQRFVVMARDLMERWDEDGSMTEAMLLDLVKALGPRTARVLRGRDHDSRLREVQRERDAAVKAMDTALEAALRRP
jgi:hypothetical protein